MFSEIYNDFDDIKETIDEELKDIRDTLDCDGPTKSVMQSIQVISDNLSKLHELMTKAYIIMKYAEMSHEHSRYTAAEILYRKLESYTKHILIAFKNAL